ncbi:hypothetical protein [Sphingomonas bacterium]|uniref:hypothetical protein n=1 Tax=Sphingomonas bacterium TaxID=1895847 RepID=UPI00157582D5|nr:hypothetical protein [Sphingomonas bacterium]
MSSPTPRNYRAEYQRRITNAAKRGLTRSQARGHARHTEPRVRPSTKPATVDDRLEQALKNLRQTGNRAAAAKSVGIAPERLRRFLRENVQIEGRGRTLKITDDRIREMPVISRGKVSLMRLRGFDQASLNSSYVNAVTKYLDTNELDVLARFMGLSVIDARGVSHPLETHPNTLRRLAHVGDELFHEIYRLVL